MALIKVHKDAYKNAAFMKTLSNAFPQLIMLAMEDDYYLYRANNFDDLPTGDVLIETEFQKFEGVEPPVLVDYKKIEL